MTGQVVAVASGKGGVGKTTTVVNLGVVLRRADYSVALVDADLGMANLGPMLGVDSEATLHDVLSGAAALEDALVEDAPEFAVVAGSASLTDYSAADPQRLGDVLETLARQYDFVLVDTGAGMSHEDVLPLGLADRVVLVATPDPAAIGDARKTAELAGLAEGDIAGLVVTKADDETDATQVASRVGVDLLGTVPYDPTVRESTAVGRPLEAIDPETPAAVAYRELASELGDLGVDPLEAYSSVEETAAGADTAATAADTAEAVDEEPAASEATEAETPEDPESAEAANTAAAEAAGAAAATVADDEDPADGNEQAVEPEADEEEDYLAEFEDDEPDSSGGLLSRISRLFR